MLHLTRLGLQQQGKRVLPNALLLAQTFPRSPPASSRQPLKSMSNITGMSSDYLTAVGVWPDIHHDAALGSELGCIAEQIVKDL